MQHGCVAVVPGGAQAGGGGAVPQEAGGATGDTQMGVVATAIQAHLVLPPVTPVIQYFGKGGGYRCRMVLVARFPRFNGFIGTPL